MKIDSTTLLIGAVVLWFVGKQQGWFGQQQPPAPTTQPAPSQPPVYYAPPNYSGSAPQPVPANSSTSSGSSDLASQIVGTVGNLGAHIIDGIFRNSGGSTSTSNSDGSWNFGVSY